MVSTHHCGLAQFEKDLNTRMKKNSGRLGFDINDHTHSSPYTTFYGNDIFHWRYFLTPRSFDKTNLEPSTHPLPCFRTFSKSIQWQEEAFRIDLFSARRPFLTEFASETSESPESACVESESDKMFDLNFENLALGWACSLSGTSAVAEFAPLLVDEPKDRATTCDQELLSDARPANTLPVISISE